MLQGKSFDNRRINIGVSFPLRISQERIWLYGIVLVFFGLVTLLLASRLWLGDWAYFVGGGATVGTRDLIGPRHVAWAIRHGLSLPVPWAYPPAVAWFFAPFTRVSLGTGYWINAAIMSAACIASGIVAARIYGVSIALSILAVLAWLPATQSISFGQNGSLALLFSLVAIYGLKDGRPLTSGLAVGLLFFKPTDAAVFLLLLLLRREWRALAVVALVGVVWYLASVPAAAGDWYWPQSYAASMHAYYPNQPHSPNLISLSGIATHFGLPVLLGTAMDVLLLAFWCLTVPKVSLLEAASFAGLFAVATSFHANPHEAALLIPAVFYVTTNVVEPWRTWIIVVAYLTAGPISYLRLYIGFAPVALVCAIGAISYVALRLASKGNAGLTGQAR